MSAMFKKFCAEHRLPESHNCSKNPVGEKLIIKHFPNMKGICPKCGPEFYLLVNVQWFNEKKVGYRCSNCGFIWESER
jgi:ssDNA-binding Zn-finger/Zn-ribbon topoisomerase 1